MTLKLDSVSRSRKRREKKKQSKERRRLELTLIKKEENDDEPTDYPTDLNDIEQFQLTEGFRRFELIYEDNNANNQTQSGNAFRLSEDLPRKAVAVAILQGTDDKDDDDEKPMSKKQWKRLHRMSVGELKVKVKRPEFVETYDNCSKDPLFLLELKSVRNSVPVPKHWCAKGKYLQGKRGFAKGPFKLPDFIARTGIMEIRQTTWDREEDKSLKTKMKEKIRPKVGTMDINYEKLYNAFFVEQTKPELTKFGDIYYQGKEFESQCKTMKPGQLSDDLRKALDIPIGKEGDRYPTPWLIQQQRYGLPPSYPKLKIPGLNAPIPVGASFGYNKNGFGKPPVYEDGTPVYPGVFENSFTNYEYKFDDDEEDDDNGKFWGEPDSDDESDKEVADDDGDKHSNKSDTEYTNTDDAIINSAGLITPGGLSSVSTSITPLPTTKIELRKRPLPIEHNMDFDEFESAASLSNNSKLFTELKPMQHRVGSDIMGSEAIYAMPSDTPTIQKGKESVSKNSSSSANDETKTKKRKFKF